MRVLAILARLVGIGLLGLSGWAQISGAGLFGLPHPKGGLAASMLGWIVLLLAIFLFPRSKRPDRVTAHLHNMSKRERAVSGAVWVIIATGLAALIFVADVGRGDPFALIPLALIAAAFGTAAFLAARFIAEYGDEIGEARFDTRNPKEDQP